MAREYIESEDLLNTGRKKLNRSIDKSYDAEETSAQALIDANKLGNEAKQISTEKGNESIFIANKKGNESIAIAKENEKVANESNLIAKDTNERMNQIISRETDSAEIIDSRKPIGLEAATTLNERLNMQFGNNEDFRPEEISLINKMKKEFEGKHVNLEWFKNESDADDTDALKRALDYAEGNIVFVPPGKFEISDIELDNNSRIVMTPETELVVSGRITNVQKEHEKTFFETRFNSGDTELQLKNNNNFKPDDLVIIYNGGWMPESDWLNNVKTENSEYAKYQICLVTSVKDNIITIEKPVEFDCKNLDSSYIESFDGTENIIFNGGAISLINDGQFRFDRIINLEVSNVSINSLTIDKDCFFLERTIKSKIELNTVNSLHNSVIWLARGSSDNLIQNNKITVNRKFVRDSTILIYYSCFKNIVANNEVTIINNSLDDKKFIGICVHTESNNNLIMKNTVTGFDQNTASYFGSRDNFFSENNLNYGLVGHVSHSSKGDTISDCTFTGNIGIQIPKSYDNFRIKIERNIFKQNSVCLNIFGSFYDSFVKSNDFYQFTKSGIFSDSNIDIKSNIFTDNIFKGALNETFAFNCYGRWENNNIISNKASSVFYFIRGWQDLTFNTITDNIVENSEHFSIFRNLSYLNKIHNNHISNISGTVFDQDESVKMNDYYSNEIVNNEAFIFGFPNERNLGLNAYTDQASIGTIVHFFESQAWDYLIKIKHSGTRDKSDWKISKRQFDNWS